MICCVYYAEGALSQGIKAFLCQNQLINWDDVVHWCVHVLKGKSLKSCVCRLAFVAIVYHLWIQINAPIYGHQVLNEESFQCN